MLLRASFLLLALGSLSACGSSKAGRLMVDSPAMPYQAPDIDELTGIDSEETDATEEKGTAPAPAPAPTPAAAAPKK